MSIPGAISPENYMATVAVYLDDTPERFSDYEKRACLFWMVRGIPAFTAAVQLDLIRCENMGKETANGKT